MGGRRRDGTFAWTEHRPCAPCAATTRHRAVSSAGPCGFQRRTVRLFCRLPSLAARPPPTADPGRQRLVGDADTVDVAPTERLKPAPTRLRPRIAAQEAQHHEPRPNSWANASMESVAHGLDPRSDRVRDGLAWIGRRGRWRWRWHGGRRRVRGRGGRQLELRLQLRDRGRAAAMTSWASAIARRAKGSAIARCACSCAIGARATATWASAIARRAKGSSVPQARGEEVGPRPTRSHRCNPFPWGAAETAYLMLSAFHPRRQASSRSQAPVSTVSTTRRPVGGKLTDQQYLILGARSRARRGRRRAQNLVLHLQGAVRPAQPHQLRPLVARQALSVALVDIDLPQPAVQARPGDPQVRSDARIVGWVHC